MAKAELPLHAPGTQLDKGYIGQSVPRANAQRLLQGRGSFIDDLRFPRLAHVAFFRSPYAHARIRRLDFSKASKGEGVIGVFDDRPAIENADDAFHLNRFRAIQSSYPGVSVRTAEERHVRQPWKAQIVDEAAATLQQALRIRAGDALPDVALVELGPRRVQRQFSFGHSVPARWRRRLPGSRCSGSSCRRCVS